MHAFGENFNCEHAIDQPAERRGSPELVVVAAAGVETHDERRRADAWRERLEVRRQVVAAALLAAFDKDDAAPLRPLVLVELAQRGERAEHRVAIIRAAAAIALA